VLTRIASLKYLVASFLFAALFFIQSLTLTWTLRFAFQALILNVAIMLGIYAFRGFDNSTTYSLNSCVVSYISGTVLGVLFALIPIIFFTPRLPRLTFGVTALVAALFFPFLSCMLMRYSIKHLPPKRYLVIGKEEELGPILEEVKKASMGKIEIYSYMNPTAATLTQAITFEETKPFDAILIGDPKLAESVQPVLNEAITNKTSIEYLPTLVENSLHRIPVEIIEMFKEYYQIVFSERRYSKRIRVLDLLFSSIILVLSIPFLLLASLAIKLEDRGALFFRQERVGFREKIFEVLKLRTMNTVTGLDGNEMSPTTTKVGKWLRKFRLNEFPQLLNVLKGEMSLVGPRPDILSTYHVCIETIPFYRYRQQVLPGLTGVSIIRMGHIDKFSFDVFSRRLSYDLYYVKNMCPRIYIEIMLRTLETIVFGKEKS